MCRAEKLILAPDSGPNQPAPPHQSSGQSEEQAECWWKDFLGRQKVPSRDCLTDSWALWPAWERGSIEEDLGSGSLSPLLWLPVTGRLRHIPHPGSRAPRGDLYLLQIVSHDVTARPVQPQCVLGPQPPEVCGGLRALLAALAVCNALPSDCPRGQLLCPSEPRCPTSSDMPPPPSFCSNHPITLHPGTNFPSLHSFIMSL